jgi:hypothetical protein
MVAIVTNRYMMVQSPRTYILEIKIGADSEQHPSQVSVGYPIPLLVPFQFLRKLCFKILKVN